VLAAGKLLGPYKIVEAIGAGGMGEVYRARDTRLDRIVAVKVLSAEFAASIERRERFEREARAVSSLNHAHICVLYDIGRQDGIDFLVMEYLEGEPLAERLQRGPLPLAEALRYAIEISDALDKAHRHGITHRDLKPGNIMITKSGAKLLDFGLAKVEGKDNVLSAQSAPTLPGTSRPLTVDGAILGTIQYMSPEQLEGEDAGARSDIFAFGATFYEMVTGRKAFEGKSQVSVMAAILEHEPPPISTLQAMTPPALDRAIRKCLAKDPDRRWQTAGDLTDELRWIAEGGSSLPAPPIPGKQKGNRQRLSWLLLAAATVLMAVIVGTALFYFRGQNPELFRFLIATAPIANPNELSISPDGRWIAFAAYTTGNTTALFIRPIDATTAQPLPIGLQTAGTLLSSPLEF
jgi:eukaryotic-like serine/threonine-protein kinase